MTRSIGPDLLVKCIRKVHAGETWLDNKGVNWVIEAYRAQAAQLTSPRNRVKLSTKELQIIAGVTQGLRNKDIAQEVGTTEQVVKNYLRKIYDKLGVSDRLELALYCMHHRLLENYSKPEGDGCRLASVRQPLLRWVATGTRREAKSGRVIHRLQQLREDSCVRYNGRCSRERILPVKRRDGRVAEGARLESVFRGNSNVGSNPTLSASNSSPVFGIS